jgi:hypothetical protein
MLRQQSWLQDWVALLLCVCGKYPVSYASVSIAGKMLGKYLQTAHDLLSLML